MNPRLLLILAGIACDGVTIDAGCSHTFADKFSSVPILACFSVCSVKSVVDFLLNLRATLCYLSACPVWSYRFTVFAFCLTTD